MATQKPKTRLILNTNTYPLTMSPSTLNLRALQISGPLTPTRPEISVDASNNQPQGDFECFPNLPNEVRHMIWEEAASSGAEIEIKIFRIIEKTKSDKKQVKIYDEMEIAEFDYHYSAIEVSNDSGLIDTCQESRFIYLKTRTDSIRLWKRGQEIRFNSVIDKIYFSNASVFYLHYLRRRLRPDKSHIFGLDSVRNLVMTKPYEGMMEDLKNEVVDEYKARISEISKEERTNGKLSAYLSSPFWMEYEFEKGRLTSATENASRILSDFRKLRIKAGAVIIEKEVS